MIRVVHPGSRIPDPDADFLPSRIPYPGSRGQKGTQSQIPDPGSGSATLLRSPGIDFEESILPIYVAWRDGTTNWLAYRPAGHGNQFLGSLKGLQIWALECREVKTGFCRKRFIANWFFCDILWLEIWKNHQCPSMGPNGGSVASSYGSSSLISSLIGSMKPIKVFKTI
jgi:hypothetical protein